MGQLYVPLVRASATAHLATSPLSINYAADGATGSMARPHDLQSMAVSADSDIISPRRLHEQVQQAVISF